MSKKMVNYHSHKYYTNAMTIADSPASYEEYIDRVTELGQTVLTSVEHGFQGNYYKLYEAIENHNKKLQKRRDEGERDVPDNIKFVFGTEAYWLKDRHNKSKGLCHIIILAKNEKGRKAINLMLSIANEEDLYEGKPIVDLELIMNLPEEDVFITTACAFYWSKYEDIDEITENLHNKFKDNFMLEVQNHNTEKQISLNKHIKEISQKYGIKMIAGLDSHYIYQNDNKRRDTIMKYKKVFYDNEEGWYMDYPDYDTVIKRFKDQNMWTDEEIYDFVNRTNIIEDFDDIILSHDMKLPTIYPNKTQYEKDEIFMNTIFNEWNKYKEEENISTEEEHKYLEGIKYEVNEVLKCNMSDYFMLHYEGLKKGKEYGGKITKRGRGSAVGYFINTLLGFSKVDRFKSPIKLYPERFMTSDRILKAKACPDIDNNIDRQEPFVKAFKELLGEHGIYPMVAFGTLGKASAVKLYMGANDEPATIQNEVTKQLKEYELAIKHAEDDEKDEIDINKYISEEYSHYVKDSKPYQGIIISKTPHACAHLLLNGDIREEVGLIKCESKQKKTSVLCACIDGATADHFGFLKTDLLIVDVVGLTEAIWERLGKKSITNNELEEIVASKEGKKAWDIYEKGLTLCVNQCEKDKTKQKCKKYKPKNTGELAQFVAAIRPGFSSLVSNFLERKPYSTDVPQLDEVLEDSSHYMLFQESIMAYLNWLGIDMKETYQIVKNISKKIYLKEPEKMKELMGRLEPRWKEVVGDDEESMKNFEKTGQVMNDAGSYAFNSSHSYCVGNDGLEIAYLKAYYPYETYEVCLNWFNNKKKKDKVSALQQEMFEGFGIEVGKLEWGRDNRKFTLNKDNNCIDPCLSSIKGMGKDVPEELWNLYNNKYKNIKNPSFIELLTDLKNTSADNSMVEVLIKLDYFKEFGKSKKLLDVKLIHDTLFSKKQFNKNKLPEINGILDLLKKYSNKETEKMFKDIDINGLINELCNNIQDNDISVVDRIKTELDYLGYITYTDNSYNSLVCVVTEVKKSQYSIFVTLYQLNSGKSTTIKVDKRFYNNKPLEQYDVITIGEMAEKERKTKDENGKWIGTGEYYNMLMSYGKVILDDEEFFEF